MAIESIGSAGSQGISPYVRELPPGRAEQAPPERAQAVGTQTRQAVNQASEGNSNAASRTVKKDELDNALKKMNEFVGSRNSDIQFSTDDETGTNIVKVIDRSSKEVIRQIPSEEMLQIAKALDKLQGLLIRQQA